MITTLYHGTCSALRPGIEREGALQPKRGNKYVYVTTDYDVAKNYARAWTAWSIENADDITEATGKRPEPKGIIIELKLDDEFIANDEYNPEGEPNQYTVEGKLYLDDAIVSEVDFTEFSDRTELMKAYAYWIGIGRANDKG